MSPRQDVRVPTPPTGLALRRALLLAAAAAVVLPLLMVTTALTGFAEVRRSHASTISLLTAQEHQQDADAMHHAVRGDVLEAVLEGGGPEESGAQMAARTRTDVGRLNEDLRRLKAVALPASIASDVQVLDASLKAFGSQAVELSTLAATQPARARAQLTSFDRAFRALEAPLGALTSRLDAEVARQTTAADRGEGQAVRWTSGVATATMGALMLLAFYLYRLGVRNDALVRRLAKKGEELGYSNDQLEAAQQVAHVGSWEWDPATGETYWSAEFYRILGLASGTTVMRHEQFMARVHPEDLPEVEGALEEAIVLGGGINFQCRIVRPAGSIRDVCALGRAVCDDSGKVVRLVGSLQDVTEQRTVERMKDEFVSVISHELRTPLTSIRGALGLMAGGAVGALPAKAQRMAVVALESCERLVRLVNDILDVEKMSAGKLELDVVPLRAAEVVAAAIGEMRAMAEQAGVTLAAMPMDALVLADRDRVAQLLTNLLSNAVKFSPAAGAVIVSAGPAPGGQGGQGLVQFTVTDQGGGLAPDQLELIFDRFAQADASDTRAKGGTGLGLPICRAIVEQHGGRIWATSAPGEGTTFSFTLPAAPAPGEDLGTRPLPIGAVLICDDDPHIVEVLATMLETHGYSTLRAHSGPEALTLAAEQAPSLVLMDLRMPGMSGWETIAALGADPATSGIPIVILSAFGPDDIAVPAASSWLTKPVDQAALMASLRRALGTGATTSVLIVEDDEGLGEVLQAFFTDHGVHARVAHTGTQALNMIRDVPPDLLVLDLGLPDIDGYAVVEALRRDERLRSLPLLVYTGTQLDAADMHRLRLGETRFVTKAGGSPADFERQVISLLRRVTAES